MLRKNLISSVSVCDIFPNVLLLSKPHTTIGFTVAMRGNRGQTCFGSGIITYIIHLHIGPKVLTVPIESVLLLQSMSATRTLPSFNQYR